MGLAVQIEDAMVEANMIRDTLLAIDSAIYNGPCSHKEFEWALYAVFIKANEHLEKMKVLTDKAYALQKGSCKEAPDMDAGIGGR